MVIPMSKEMKAKSPMNSGSIPSCANGPQDRVRVQTLGIGVRVLTILDNLMFVVYFFFQ
jgi:hypothetical protein